MKRIFYSVLCTLLFIGLLVGLVWLGINHPIVLGWIGIGLFAAWVFAIFYEFIFGE